jgi:hypothetical protein
MLIMKIRFLKDTLLEVEKSRLEEVWDRNYKRWEEIHIDTVIDNGPNADLYTRDGDLLFNVPRDAFEVVR